MTPLVAGVRRFLVLTTLALSGFTVSFGQAKLGSLTAGQVRIQWAKYLPSLHGFPAPADGIDFYRMDYDSPNPAGEPTRISGCLAAPHGGAPNGLVVYCHGTLADRSLSPSRLTGQSGGVESLRAALVFATNGYAVAMPDYLGLGDDPAVHPYPLAKVNAYSVRDILEPCASLLQLLGKVCSRRLFLTGYSEGGAVCVAAAELLEAQPPKSFDLIRVAPLSGPYDLTGETARSLLSQQSNPTWLGTRFFLAAYIGHSASALVPDLKLEDYFAPSFARYIPYVFSKRLPDNKAAERFAIKGFQLGAIKSIRKVLTPRFISALDRLDQSDPLVRKLVENDVSDWVPKTKTLLVCLRNDYVVTERNTLMVHAKIRSAGIDRWQVRKVVINNPSLTHLTALPETLAVARTFFDAGFLAIPGSD